ncbi:MAG: DNA-directed RNA polymerase subunit alpha C-terminal domain-containing protein [Thermoguttaceae bacterium]
MSRSEKDSRLSESGRESRSLERYDLTGHKIRGWTVRARGRLAALFGRLVHFGRRAAATTLPGSEQPVGDKAKKLPAKGLDFVEAQIDKTGVENQLKIAQTETEFYEQELLREQITKARAETAKIESETKGQHLDNLARQLEIQERIAEITEGKTDVRIVSNDGEPAIVFGNIPALEDFRDQPEISPYPIRNLGLPMRATEALIETGVERADDLCGMTRAELLALNGIGPKTADLVELKLSELGMQLAE